ncbi:MAG: tetratricopeptide repeat protein [Candidatus Sericytochromatia bacterium]|nr:tetratricopeptide repeat protein [Candidatus Sericytochromatia bacterium]
MDNFNSIFNLAKVEHQKGNFLEAKRLYIQLLEFDSSNSDINHLLGVIYSQLKDKQNAYLYFKKAIKINPHNPDFYTNMAKILLSDDKTKQAIELLSDAVKNNPKIADTYLNLANIFKMNNNYPKAIENYKKAIEIKPDFIDAYNNLGICYTEHFYNIEAHDAFKKVLELNPNYPNIDTIYSFLKERLLAEQKVISSSKNFNIFSRFEYKFDNDELINDHLTLLKKCLTDTLNVDEESIEFEHVNEGIKTLLYSKTMIGIKRLNNLHYCIVETIKNNIDGDLVETGVWRGGATILMRAILKAYNIKDKLVWVADSFEGLPQPNPNLYPADKNLNFNDPNFINVSIEEVKSNFRKYGLLDDQVKFLKGWFKDTLPDAQIEKISVLRLDGDMYESTMDAMKYLYPKLSIGGYVIVDDWGALPMCKQAIIDYRNKYNIKESIYIIDSTGIYWKKEKDI